jgi:hypothetical protein
MSGIIFGALLFGGFVKITEITVGLVIITTSAVLMHSTDVPLLACTLSYVYQNFMVEPLHMKFLTDY